MLGHDIETQLKRWNDWNVWIAGKFPEAHIPEIAFEEMPGKLGKISPHAILFYGFGNDGNGQADPALSGHIAISYLIEKYPHEMSRFVDFYPPQPDPMRFDFYRPKVKMREGAAARPQGFYVKSLLSQDADSGVGTTYKALSPAEVRKMSPWGWGPEGFELLALHGDYTQSLVAGKVPMFVLGDYAIAPYGGNEFYSVPFLGSLHGKLEIGTTNVRDNIPKYAPSHFL